MIIELKWNKKQWFSKKPSEATATRAHAISFILVDTSRISLMGMENPLSCTMITTAKNLEFQDT